MTLAGRRKPWPAVVVTQWPPAERVAPPWCSSPREIRTGFDSLVLLFSGLLLREDDKQRGEGDRHEHGFLTHGESATDFAHEFGASRATVYKVRALAAGDGEGGDE